MERRSYAVAMAFVLLLVASVASDTVSKPRIGQAKPTWFELPGTDGQVHSLADLADKQAVVVAITCNHCPIAIEYFSRLKEFSKKYCGADGPAALVAISVSNTETDKLPRMKEIAKEKEFNFLYLHDESQRVALELGATHTPQFFVLNRDRVMVYRGAWDDSLNESKSKIRYVEDAVKAILEGSTPSVTETRAIGCGISFKKS